MKPLPKSYEPPPNNEVTDAQLALILSEIAEKIGCPRLLDIALDLLGRDVHKFLREHGM